MILEMNEIQGSKYKVQKTMNRVFEFLEVPTDDVMDISPKNTRKYEPMTLEVTILLFLLLN